MLSLNFFSMPYGKNFRRRKNVRIEATEPVKFLGQIVNVRELEIHKMTSKLSIIVS